MPSSLNNSTVYTFIVRIPFTRMFRILTVAVTLGSFRILLAAEETCNTYIENVNCSDRDKSELLYICESGRTENCSCILENPLRSEVGWFKTCRTKNSLKIRKKKVRKRQVAVQNLCGTISPPNPGKVSCSVSQTDIKCIGTCDPDYQFIDGEQEQTYSCIYSDGMWQPENNFPPCEPKCNPPCENDGICSSVNFCSCPNNYRGNACQYPITLCGISKNKYASNWKCNHTRTETSCDVSCHPPDTAEAELDVYRYECNVEGEWDPPLPPCVQVPQCEKPPSIKNGHWQLAIGHTFIIGSKIIYSCEDGFVLQGERFTICKSNGTWSDVAPVCIQRQDICNDPGDVPHGRRSFPSLGFFEGSTVSYECLGNFVLLGDAVIQCMDNGQWSSRKPRCVPRENAPIFCPKPNAPRNSLIHVTFPSQHPFAAVFNKDNPMSQRLYVINFAQGQDKELAAIPESTFAVGTRVQYKCKSRYRLYGSEYQTCLSSRTWSGYQPACVPECGKSDSPKTPFIVNGDSTRVGQWPWQVGIAVKTHRGLQLLCGAVLINELWVLTAAHCVAKKLSNIPMDNRDLLVFCGKYYRNFEQDDEFVQVKQVRQIVIHEEYDFVNFDGDIALLQLEDAVELTTRVQPICLPTDDTTRENIRDGKKGIVIGWGLTENGRYSEALKETVLPVVSHDRCEEAYREGLRSVTITRNMFCAGHESGLSDTCNGDSGGPYMFAVGLANDIRWYLEGLVSWGSESGCGKALRYSGFTKVGRFVPWINMFI